MNEDLQTFIEPELEARLVALVLGEASAFEREELERVMAERPEARHFKTRLEILHGLIGQATKPMGDDEWKLAPARREKVLAQLRDPEVIPVPVPEEKPERLKFFLRVAFYGSAACLTLGGVFFPMGKVKESSYSMAETEEVPNEGFRFGPSANGPQIRSVEESFEMRSRLSSAKGSPDADASRDARDTPKATHSASKSGDSQSNASDLLAGIDDNLFLQFEDQSAFGRQAGNGRTLDSKSIINPDFPEMTWYSSNTVANVQDGGLKKNLSAFLESESEIEGLERQSQTAMPDPSALAFGYKVDSETSPDLLWENNSESGAPASWDSSLGGPREIEEVLLKPKPAAPASSMSSAIATNTASPDAIPIPQLVTDFGDADDFGNALEFKEKQVETANGIVTAGVRVEAEGMAPGPAGKKIATANPAKPASPTTSTRSATIADLDSAKSEPAAEPMAKFDRETSQQQTTESLAFGIEVPGPPELKTSDSSFDANNGGLAGRARGSVAALPEMLENEKLMRLGDEVAEKRKELQVLLMQNGTPYFDGRTGNPVGATEEEVVRDSQRKLGEIEAKREQVALQLGKLMSTETEDIVRTSAGLDLPENQVATFYSAYQAALDQSQALEARGLGENHPEVTAAREEANSALEAAQEKASEAKAILETKLALLDQSAEKISESVDRKQSTIVDLTGKQQAYQKASDEYTRAQEEFRELKSEIEAKTSLAEQPADDSDPFGGNSVVDVDIDGLASQLSTLRGVTLSEGVTESDVKLTDTEIEAIPLYKGFADDEGEEVINKKLNEIILPELDLSNVTIEEALAIVQQKAREADASGVDDFTRGIDLKVRTPRALKDEESGLGGGPTDIVIKNLNLKNVPLKVALQYLSDEANLRYRVDGDGVTMLAGGADAEADVVQRRWTVPENFEALLSLDSGSDHIGDSDPFGGGEIESDSKKYSRMDIVELLKSSGVTFSENTSASLLSDSNTLIVRNSPTNLDLIDGIVKVSEQVEAKIKAAEAAAAQQKKLEAATFETSTVEKSDSTFSLNVSDVSFKLAKSSLAEGKWPEADKVRPEEFVNALSYGDDSPTQAEKVACVIEQGNHPFMQQRDLMRVSMSTAALGRNASTPLRLTVLLDQSGSMERADRAESVRRAFALLAKQLNAGDEITLVGFARTPRLLAERVKGDEAEKLVEIVSNPLTEGGTNLEAALASGLQLAKQQFVEGAQNRIILLTDGAANLGDALPENLAKQVATMRETGIAFDACGVGADGLNDDILTSLTKQGDGRYYFLDRPEDADDGFARQIAGALRPAAKNVKVQVIFNPARVSKFMLYGFEKHQLKKEDFRNDSVDAAEMAAEESGVALYHFETMPEGRGDVGTVSVRFLDTATNQMVERTWAIPYETNSASFSEANPNLRLAAVAGLFAERLKGSPVGVRVDLKRLRQEGETLKPVFQDQTRFQELLTMLRQAGE